MPNFWLTVPLLIREDTRTLSFWVCISALLLSWINKLFSCVLHHTVFCVSNNKFCNCFYSFCLLETFLLSNRGKIQGTLLLALASCGLVASAPGFHLGVLGLIPGQGAKISLQDHLLPSLQDHDYRKTAGIHEIHVKKKQSFFMDLSRKALQRAGSKELIEF